MRKCVTGSLSWERKENASIRNSIGAFLGLFFTTSLLKSHMVSSLVSLSSSAFPSHGISDSISSGVFVNCTHCNRWFDVYLWTSVSSLLLCVLLACTCGKSERVRSREWEGGRVRRSTAVQINECAISGWVSSLLPARPPACTNLRLNALYTHAPYTHTHTRKQYVSGRKIGGWMWVTTQALL